ncbi:MAG: tetratricopeptide repeat protein [Verrucomicrobiales bacterium]|nr:tetratricopeptide repeat protein [Verrucomicrobiales bacterium]
MRRVFSLIILLISLSGSVFGQADYKRYYDEDNLPKAREIFRAGRYDIIVQICDYSLQRGQPSWEWRTLRFQALKALGRYEEALEEARTTTELFPDALGALLEAHAFFKETGHSEDADRILMGINKAAQAVPTRERTPLDLVFLGRAAVVLGGDPDLVIDKYYGPAKDTKFKGREAPEGVLEAHLYTGYLALDKDDFGKAATAFEAALKLDPDRTDTLFGLARSYFPTSRQIGGKYLEKLLEISPRHYGALLLEAEYAIIYENYEEAVRRLQIVLAMNPRHPLAWTYSAILAELVEPNSGEFDVAREKALSVWKNNPEIDHVIGRVLSKKYRYAEGAAAQRRALEFDPQYLPAKLQLALDYLRLGEVEKAWPLAKEVGAADEYNVLAYNLEVLQKEIDSFASVTTDDFIIRLPPEEAPIYGDQVVSLLTDAKTVLTEKYGLTIDEPTLIEFYPNQQDFAVRSFGALGGEGLLGVCFGSVVTMNSPGSLTAGKNNWEATLWHEYCHVITLTATKNKMPRWLSEGISVYEEMQRQSNWGQRMSPRYRKMILEEEALTPIGKMSEAFFSPKNAEYVMFAYYQSMLVVDYIVKNFGEASLRGILADLAGGVLINEAIERNTTKLDDLESNFAAMVLDLATNYGNGVDWSEPAREEVNPLSGLAVAAFVKKNPKNLWGLQIHTGNLLKNEQWDLAIESADRLIALLPEFAGSGNGYAMKARALREKGDSAGEVAVLEKVASLSAEALAAYNRLIETKFDATDWSGVVENSERSLAINPFIERTHYCQGCAHEGLEEVAPAVGAFEKSLALDPANPSEVRFRLARLLAGTDKEKAKRYVLDSLADSLRYQEAYELLSEMTVESDAGHEEGDAPLPQ